MVSVRVMRAKAGAWRAAICDAHPRARRVPAPRAPGRAPRRPSRRGGSPAATPPRRRRCGTAPARSTPGPGPGRAAARWPRRPRASVAGVGRRQVEDRDHGERARAGRHVELGGEVDDAREAREVPRRAWRARARSRRRRATATGAGCAPGPPARVEPGAGEVRREQPPRRRPQAPVRALLEARRAEPGVARGDERQRQRGPAEPQRRSRRQPAPRPAQSEGAAGVQRAPAGDAQGQSPRATRQPACGSRARANGHSQTHSQPSAKPVGMSMKWCWYVVSTDAPISRNQSGRAARARRPRVLRAYSTHRITASAMCSDGIWLYGRSKPSSASNIAPNTPSAPGRSNEKRYGTATKQATATSCAVSRRFACVSSSRRDVQTKSDSP